jgi:hypothetical protein
MTETITDDDKTIAKPKSKPGYKTTEFYFALAASLIGIAWASGLVSDGSNVDKVIGFVAMALGQLGYTVSRTLVKK